MGMAGVALRFFFDVRGAVRDLGSIIFFAVYLSFSLFMAALTAHAFVRYWAAIRRTAEISASRERLKLMIRGRWRTTSHLWERDRLVGFDADLHGLWIFGTGRPKAWLAERPQPELRWLAELLGAALDLPSREPKREGEIDVYVELDGNDAANAFGLDLRDDKVQHARLAVHPGRMTLRLAANRLHQWRFFQPRRTWWRLPEWMRVLYLAFSRLTPLEEDALSWQSDDDAAYFAGWRETILDP